MTITVHASGTASPTVGGAWVNMGGSVNTATGAFQLYIDTAGMVLDDEIEIRLKEKAISGGTERIALLFGLLNQVNEPHVVLPPYALLHGWTFELRQIAGTARAFPWSLRKIAEASEHASGTQLAVIGSDHALGSSSYAVAGAFQLFVDMANMVRNDLLWMRKYETVNGSQRRVFSGNSYDTQEEPMWISPVIGVIDGWKFEIHQQSGTGRNFPWSIRKIGS